MLQLSQKHLILASGSPRRRELLTRMGLSFTVCPADADETLKPGLAPREQVMRLSRIKAEDVRAKFPGEDDVILSADTVVVLGGEILGKPKDPADACRMLRALSGKSHLVLTGVTVQSGSLPPDTRCEETEVRFRELSAEEISAYTDTGEPMDKAGAYGIQGYGALFVESLAGDYYNVMGLPVCLSGQMLRKAGIPVLGTVS